MPDTAWKAFERRIATSLGAHRTPLSGSGSGHTSSDTLHPDLYIECKERAAMPVANWFHLARVNAAKENKLPVLALHATGSRTNLAVLDWSLFLYLWNRANITPEDIND